MRNSFLFIFIFLIAISCTDNTEPVPEQPIEETPVFSLKIDGTNWTPTEYYYDIKGDGISIIYATDKIYTFSWTFDTELKEKEYLLGLKENQLISGMSKRVEGKNIPYDILSGTLKVLKYDLDDQILKCSFSFSAQYNGERVEVKEGKIFINNFK